MKLLRPYIFLAGFAITGVEMAASRFLAPYFGTSQIVWANVIGVILLAMAVGYAVGGRLADKYPRSEVMFAIGTVGSFILALLPLGAHFILARLAGNLLATEVGLIISTFVATLLLFGMPVFLFAMLSPFALKLLAQDVEVLGKHAGTLSFLSTLGSILGIFVTSFLLLPLLGVKETMWLFAAVLCIPSLFGIQKKLLFSLIAAFIIVLLFLTNPVYASEIDASTLVERESMYQHIEIREGRDGTRSMLFNEGQGIQSMYNPKSLYTGAYYDFASILPQLTRFEGSRSLNALILGYAGGTAGKMLRAGSQNTIKIDAVEIDPTVTELSKEFFGVTEEERQMYHMDGRSFMHQATSKYDIVMVDAYSNEIYIPAHMITKEFFEEIGGLLTEKGILVFNINALSEESALFKATIATLEAAGFQVQSIKVLGSYNHWIIASQEPLIPAFTQAFDDVQAALQKSFIERITEQSTQPDALILSDNKSPIDMLIHMELFQALLLAR